ncbi:hypothetical protein BDN70DRAFT_404288, partial [Pholiota conissans]
MATEQSETETFISTFELLTQELKSKSAKSGPKCILYLIVVFIVNLVSTVWLRVDLGFFSVHLSG